MENQSLQYLDPYSMLVISSKGELKRLYCPFKVQCIEPAAIYPMQTVLQVEKINLFPEDKIYYSIRGKPYPCSLFAIVDV